MLKYIRSHALVKVFLWVIIIAFVATIFYSWGAGGQVEGANKTIATVNGMKIQVNEFNRAYGNILNFYRDQFHDQFSDEMAAKLNLKENALEALIQNRLILAEAEKMNLLVSNQELVSSISKRPEFQKDRKYSNVLYQNYLNFNRITPREFEESHRKDILRK